MEDVIENSVFYNYPDCNLFLVGKSGITHVHKGNERLCVDVDELMQYRISVDALSHTQSMVVQYMESGFTNMTKDVPMVVFAKVIGSEGIVYITIQE